MNYVGRPIKFLLENAYGPIPEETFICCRITAQTANAVAAG
jgi:hypothetical protein